MVFTFAVMVFVGLVALGLLLLLASVVTFLKLLGGNAFARWRVAFAGAFLGVGSLAAAQALGAYMGWWT